MEKVFFSSFYHHKEFEFLSKDKMLQNLSVGGAQDGGVARSGPWARALILQLSHLRLRV